MEVKATEKGFYNKLMVKGERFTLKPRNDEFIKSLRKGESDKDVTSTERSDDVKLQFSSVWMERVPSIKKVKTEA